MVGYKNKEMTGDRQPNWRRRILEKQKVLRKELGQLNRMRRGKLQNEGVISELERKFNVKRKGAKVVHEEVRQKLVKDQINSLVNTLRFFSENIKMEFELPKGGELIIKREKVVKREGIVMPNGKMMKNIEEGGYKYLGILEADGVKHEEMKDQIKKEQYKKKKKVAKR